MPEEVDFTLQDLYTRVDVALETLEQDLLELEKSCYSLAPLHERMQNRLTGLLLLIKDQKTSGQLAKRLRFLQNQLQAYQKERGYDNQAFQNFFGTIHHIRQNAAAEIVPSVIFDRVKSRLGLPAGKIAARRQMQKFLMARNGNMYFLLPCDQKVWEKELPAEKTRNSVVKMKIASLQPPNVFTFVQLPGREPGAGPRVKKALLLQNRQGQKTGIITDESEGFIYLDQNLFRNNLQRMQISEEESMEYLRLKGQRYFIYRNPGL